MDYFHSAPEGGSQPLPRGHKILGVSHRPHPRQMVGGGEGDNTARRDTEASSRPQKATGEFEGGRISDPEDLDALPPALSHQEGRREVLVRKNKDQWNNVPYIFTATLTFEDLMSGTGASVAKNH
jgi:hypothetical protein